MSLIFFINALKHLYEMNESMNNLKHLLITKQTNEQVLDQIKPETSLEVKMTKLKLSCFGHTIGRQGSLEKTTMLGKREGGRKRERPHRRWTDPCASTGAEQRW